MITATGWVRCVFLVVVSLLIDFVDCFPMGYQTLGTIGASTRRTPLTLLHKNCAEGEARLELFSDFPKCNWTRLELLASPMVQTLRYTTPHKPLVSLHGTTPIKPSARA